MPVLIRKRRPETSLSERERRIIDEVYAETRRGARLLYYEIKKRKNLVIPKNKIHAYLREKDYTMPNPRKQRQHKRCRYEREHSGSLLHADWHQANQESLQVILWLDDASRKVISGGEFLSADTNNTIATLKEAQKAMQSYNVPIREVNTDQGTQFYNNKGESLGRFEEYLQEEGITFVPSRRSNPQTNGKLERHWQEYDRHRNRFNTLQEFINWYGSSHAREGKQHDKRSTEPGVS
jgi:putative transposase